MIPYKMRTPKEEDVSFIFNSWLKSYRSSDFAKNQCNSVYYENYKKIVENIINRSLITILCNVEDDNHILGYVVFEELPGENLLLHYLYIKHTYRKCGLAKNVISSIRKSNNPILTSHHTRVCETSKSIIYVYDPYRAFYSLTDL
jgi:hypothetical protein